MNLYGFECFCMAWLQAIGQNDSRRVTLFRDMAVYQSITFKRKSALNWRHA